MTGQTSRSVPDGDNESAGGATIELRAAEQHRRNRQRSLHFNAAVMEDWPMDVMLVLTVADEQNRVMTVSGLLMACRMTRQQGANRLNELASARLIEIQGNAAMDSAVVRLTVTGKARMHSYLTGMAA